MTFKTHGLSYLACALVICGCNPLVSTPTTQSGFNPGINSGAPASTPVPFTTNFSFASANSSQYNFDASKIDFTGGVAELSSSNQTDNSNIGAGFAGGSSTGTTWLPATSPSPAVLMLSQSNATNNSELDASWTPQWSNIVGYWKLNESASTGTAVDSSPLGTNLGVVQGSVSQGVVGKLKNAVQFNSSGYISIPSTSSLKPAQITIAGWMNLANLNFQVPFGKAEFVNSSCSYGLVYRPGMGMTFTLANSGGAEYYATSTNAATSTWQYWVGTYDGAVEKLYLNGVLQDSETIDIAIGQSDNAPFTLGSYATGILPITGLLDEVAVWNTALTAQEILTIYSRQSAQYAGTFTSRVMDGLSTSASWTSFSWIPTLPFFKELPDSTNPASPVSETQANYSSQSASLMNGIVGLWHLDEPSGATSAIDASGSGNSGTPSNVTFGTTGKLGSAASFNGTSSSISLPVLSTATTNVTMSAWIYSNSASQNGVIFHNGHPNHNGYGFIVGNGNCGTGSILSLVIGGSTCGITTNTYALPVNQWVHIALTGSGSTWSLYANGAFISSGTAGFVGTPFVGASIGGNVPASNNYFNGYIDEASFWNRALSASEILELYRRGANRIKYQVRTCTASDCSDDATGANWKGPDNTNQTYFSELNNNAVQSDGGDLATSDSVQAGLPTMTFANFPGLTVPTNRYLQYRAILESDDMSTNCNYGSGATWCSPELKSVSAGPGHFDTTAPTITNKTGVTYDTLTSLIETLGGSGCSSGTLYDLSPDNTTWYYWTGAAWGIADGTVSKANPATTLTTHLPTFATQVGTGSLYFKAFLQSSGTSACAIDSLAVGGTP